MNFKMLEQQDIKTFKFNNIVVFQTCTLKCFEYIVCFLGSDQNKIFLFNLI